MRPRDRGVIVSVGSALAFRGIPLQAAYCGSKFAVRGFMQTLRTELLHDGSHIRVSMVHLPALNTPQFDWCRNRLPGHPQPVPPIYQPEVAAEAIVAAARDPAASADRRHAGTGSSCRATRSCPACSTTTRRAPPGHRSRTPTATCERDGNLDQPADDEPGQRSRRHWAVRRPRAGGVLDRQFLQSLGRSDATSPARFATGSGARRIAARRLTRCVVARPRLASVVAAGRHDHRPARRLGHPATDARLAREAAGPRQLYLKDCAVCHGADARGTSKGPTLEGWGRAGVDYALTTGRMPLSSPGRRRRCGRRRSTTRPRSPPSRTTSPPSCPAARTSPTSTWPTVTSRTAARRTGRNAPPATNGPATAARCCTARPRRSAPPRPTQIAEAVRTGPGDDAACSVPTALSDAELADVARYVQYLDSPDDRGGQPLWHLGPVAEGAVGLLALAALMVVVRLIGSRTMTAAPSRERTIERAAATAFLVAAAAGFGLMLVYWRGGQPQLEGLLVAIAFGGFALGPRAVGERAHALRAVRRAAREAHRRPGRSRGAARRPGAPRDPAADRSCGVPSCSPGRPSAPPCCSRCGRSDRSPAAPCSARLGPGAAASSRLTAHRCAPTTVPLDGLLTVFPEGDAGLVGRAGRHDAGPARPAPPAAGAAGLDGRRHHRLLEGLHACRLPGRPVRGHRPPAAVPLPPVGLRRPPGREAR